MSFLDRFKTQAGAVAGAAGDVAQNAVKQTKSLASIGRLKLAIATEEDKVKKAYTELGRLYYRDQEAGVAPAPEDYEPWIGKVSEAKAQIELLNDAIAQIRSADGAAEEAEEVDETLSAEDVSEVAEDVSKAAEAAAEEILESAEAPIETLYVDETNAEE